MSRRFGVSISHYGGISWKLAELERELERRSVRILELRSCPYPEMARSEQIRQARLGGIETVVFLDPHMEATLSALEEMVAVAERHGVASIHDKESPWVLECAAIRRDVIEAMVREEERRYANSAVDIVWNNEKIAAVPVASPWNRDGSPLVEGQYLTDGQALVERARRVGAVIVQHHPDGVKSLRRRVVARAANLEGPLTSEPGSRFALCIPSFGALDLDQRAAVFALEKAGMTVFALHDLPWIDQARSWLSERALAQQKGVFFLDHDIVFQPNDVLKLCEQALERDAVVAAPYCMRRSGKSIIGSFDLPPGPIRFFEGGGTFPAFYSGLGFAAVPASVLTTMTTLPWLQSRALAASVGWGERIRPWYALDCSTGFYAGEDVSFCNRVHDLTVRVMERQDGHEPEWGLSHSGRPARVFLDSRVRIFHRGSYDYGIEDVGIVVPRIESLESVMCETRAEAHELLVNALELPVDVKLGMQDFEAA